MDAAYNLARWVTHNEHVAEDIVQEAYLREFKLFDGSHGTDARAWLKLKEKDKLARFEQSILPHLDAAYNLARWLTRNEHDAEDVAQDAMLRAFKFFGGFHGGNSRSWLLSIVRNTAYTWLQKNRRHEIATVFYETKHDVEDPASNPEVLLLKNADRQ